MNVSDYDIDWDSGLFTCCMDHIQNNSARARLGDIIECEHCGKSMVLQQCADGVIRWRAVD